MKLSCVLFEMVSYFEMFLVKILPFMLASDSKAITASAQIHLYADGKLDVWTFVRRSSVLIFS